MEYLLLAVGFILLIKGADLFVDGAAAVADRFKIPHIIIGLTVVAFGTSAPEMAVSISAAIKGSNDIAVANVVGSNIFNLLAVVGISALISPIAVKKSIMKSEYPFSIIITLGFLGLCILNGVLSRIDGIILLAIFAIFVFKLIKDAMSGGDGETGEIKSMPVVKSIILISVGLTAVVIGGDVVVDNAKIIAKNFGMSDMLIGLTIVAIGTSLPELVTSVVASKKGENDIALGNVVGSNIFNILLVVGMSSTIKPILVSGEAIMDVALLTVMTIGAFFLTKTRYKVSRTEGGIMVFTYIAYSAYIIMR